MSDLLNHSCTEPCLYCDSREQSRPTRSTEWTPYERTLGGMMVSKLSRHLRKKITDQLLHQMNAEVAHEMAELANMRGTPHPEFLVYVNPENPHAIALTLKRLLPGAKLCDDCGVLAVWVRRTQFSGNHLFCVPHAEAQKDFGTSDPSYFYWERVSCKQTHQFAGG